MLVQSIYLNAAKINIIFIQDKWIDFLNFTWCILVKLHFTIQYEILVLVLKCVQDFSSQINSELNASQEKEDIFKRENYRIEPSTIVYKPLYIIYIWKSPSCLNINLTLICYVKHTLTSVLQREHWSVSIMPQWMITEYGKDLPVTSRIRLKKQSKLIIKMSWKFHSLRQYVWKGGAYEYD